MPFLFLFYITGYLDRVNVGFAKLQMMSDLGWSDSIYGLGAGMFFIGYFILEVPSNLILYKVGAREWIATIMAVWGLISAAMMFVHTPLMFYTLRLCLGLAEAGFFPGMMYYFTIWFPLRRRGRIVALFMSAIGVSGVVGGPLSGWIMHAFDGLAGLKGWQWLFVLEGLPAVVWAGLVLLVLDDSIRKARWLTDAEKDLLEYNVTSEVRDHRQFTVLQALAHPAVLLLAVVDFFINAGLYGIGFWLPQILKDTGVTDLLHIGLLSAIPYGVAVVVMILVGRHSDQTGERRWHLALSFFVGAVGLVGCGLFGHQTVLSMFALTIAATGILTCFPIFWTLPSEFLTGVGVATAIGLINSSGNLAGFVSPWLLGTIKDATHSVALGLYTLAAGMTLGGVIVLARKVRRHPLAGEVRQISGVISKTP